MNAHYKLFGYEVKVGLGTVSLKNYEPGYRIELKLPNGGVITHCSSNIAEAMLEILAKANLLTNNENITNHWS